MSRVLLRSKFNGRCRARQVTQRFVVASLTWIVAILLQCCATSFAQSKTSSPLRTAALPPSTSAGKLAKFEPPQGCYIGAFIELDYNVEGSIEKFEDLTQKKHASYFTYVGYGRPFPKDWVEKVKKSGAAPQIAFEPNNGLEEVQDDAYLRAWARDAARAQVPIFLRWASEMNGPWTWKLYFSGAGKETGDPAEYVRKFQLVARVMREEAPNVAMVWTPFAEPQRLISDYYPGDEWVDWLGVNIYSVYVNNGDPARPAFDKDPVAWLRFINDTYPNKPIHISEFAATIFCKGSSKDTVDFAIEKMKRFYTAIRDEFPRVKSVNWFCWDTIRGKKANNNYSFLSDGRTLLTYRDLVGNDHFLTQVVYDPSTFRRSISGNLTTLGPAGQKYRPGVSLEKAMEDSGAILVGLTEPALRGINDGDILQGDLNLRAQLPLDMEVKALMWQINGRTVALTNTKPYRVYIPFDKIGPGKHTARVVAFDAKTFKQIPSAEITFELTE